MFKPVTREQSRLRMAIDGPSGSGKTYTALRFAFALAGENGRVAVIDTERGSAAKYAGENPDPDGRPWHWDGVELQHFAPSTYREAIDEAGRLGYSVLVIDSLTHAWVGKGGALQQVDRSTNRNRWAAWGEVTPEQEAMVDAIMQSPCHVIATMRTKTEWVAETDEKTGKTVPKKIGLKAQQRDGIEYEFDVVIDMDDQHRAKVSKTRCKEIDGDNPSCPGAAWMEKIKRWLTTGKPAEDRPHQPPVRDGNGDGTAIAVDTKRPNDPDKAWANGYASAAQIEDIKILAKRIGWQPTDLRCAIEKRGFNRLTELKYEDAYLLSMALRSKADKMEADQAF